ncbi:MAG: PKD repeat protein, partial [Chitinophagales bacterium]
CEGNDGSIAVDFGNQSIAGNLIEWNYEVVLNSQTLASSTEADMIELADLEPGDYELTFTNGNLQLTEWITIADKIQVEAEFTPSVTQLFTGEELVLTNASLGATDYTWAINNEVFNSTDLNYTFSTPGTYVVGLTSSNTDCEASYEETIIVNEKTTGISEQIELENVLVYTKGNSIVIDLSNVDLEGQTDLEIYDLLGKLIVQKLDIQTIEQIEMANQAKGYYFVNIINQKEQISKKVIIK